MVIDFILIMALSICINGVIVWVAMIGVRSKLRDYRDSFYNAAKVLVELRNNMERFEQFFCRPGSFQENIDDENSKSVVEFLNELASEIMLISRAVADIREKVVPDLEFDTEKKDNKEEVSSTEYGVLEYSDGVDKTEEMKKKVEEESKKIEVEPATVISFVDEDFEIEEEEEEK